VTNLGSGGYIGYEEGRLSQRFRVSRNSNKNNLYQYNRVLPSLWKISPAFYRIWLFITMLTKFHHWNQPILSHINPISSISLRSISTLSSHPLLGLLTNPFPPGLQPNDCLGLYLSSLLWILPVPSSLSCFIWSLTVIIFVEKCTFKL
jgi:hypothetical protein